MLTVPTPLKIDSSLLISLSSADSEINLYRISLKFEHRSSHLCERAAAVINELAVLHIRDCALEEVG